MNKMLMGLVFMISCLPVLAEDITYTKETLKRALGRINNLGPLEPSVQRFCEQNINDIVMEDCSLKERQTLAFQYDVANVYIARIGNDLLRYFNNKAVTSNPEKYRNLSNISKTVGCMKKKLGEELQFRCHKTCGEGQAAWIHTNTPRVVNFCPLSFRFPGRHGASIILHEVSHFCGAKDLQYHYGLEQGKIKNMTKPNADIQWRKDYSVLGQKILTLKSVAQPEKNADNFHYWGAEGFCLPGHDCR